MGTQKSKYHLIVAHDFIDRPPVAANINAAIAYIPPFETMVIEGPIKRIALKWSENIVKCGLNFFGRFLKLFYKSRVEMNYHTKTIMLVSGMRSFFQHP